MISVKNSTWSMTLASCRQILSPISKASYPVFRKEGTGHQGVLPFCCSFSAWNNRRRLPGALLLPWQMTQCEPLLEMARAPGAGLMLWCPQGPGTDLGCCRVRMAELWGWLHRRQGLIALLVYPKELGWRRADIAIIMHTGACHIQKRRLWQCLHSPPQV